MPATYEPIATTTLGSAASTIDFTSIGGTYTDLRVVLIGTSANATSMTMRFNSDTGSNYSLTSVYGNGTSAASARATSASWINLNNNIANSTTIPALFTIDVFSYSGSTNKTALITANLDFNGSRGIRKNCCTMEKHSGNNNN